jgi:hypothetical protein
MKQITEPDGNLPTEKRLNDYSTDNCAIVLGAIMSRSANKSSQDRCTV